MALRSLDNISCSLNLGLPYSVSYDWSPNGGTSIEVFFVNEAGVYQTPTLSIKNKVNIKIGPASFSLYPVEYELQLAGGRRVISVKFVDETFALDNFYIAMPGRGMGSDAGRGSGVYELGEPVDPRTLAQKMANTLDSQQVQINEITRFPDYEYNFNQFLSVVKQRFNVKLLVSVNVNVYRDFMGTFKDVLTQWCNYFDISYFFENGVLVIFDPTTLSLTLPDAPADAVAYTKRVSIENTYSKAMVNYFQDEGSPFNFSPLAISVQTLFPIGYEFNLPQTEVNMNQVVAAAYGQSFWFLYNYYNLTAAQECGWRQLSLSDLAALGMPVTAGIYQSAQNLGGLIAVVDQDKFNKKFQMYSEYGQKIAGRYYLSNEIGTSLDSFAGYTWYNESQGQIFTFAGAEDKKVSPQILSQQIGQDAFIPETQINEYYAGINYTGNRFYILDNYQIDLAAEFALTTTVKGQIDAIYQKIFDGTNGDSGLDFSKIPTQGKYYIYIPTTIPQTLINIMNTLSVKYPLFQPRFTSFPIKGTTLVDFASKQATINNRDSVETVTQEQGATIIQNSSVFTPLRQGSKQSFLSKHTTKNVAATDNTTFKRKFLPKRLSPDNQVNITIANNVAANNYIATRNYVGLTRDLTPANLTNLTNAANFQQTDVTFSLNYFYDIPQNFLTNGLVSMSVSVGDGGIQASYSFSNSILDVPKLTEANEKMSKLDQYMKNSWITRYQRYPVGQQLS